MTITSKTENNTVTLFLDGRLDSMTASQLDAAVAEVALTENSLIVDCEKLEYISSSGLRMLIKAKKTVKGSLKLIHVNEMVAEVLEITGFNAILTIE